MFQEDARDSADFLGSERRAIRTPDAIALLAPGREALSYARLQAQRLKSRETFHHLGLAPRDTIAVVMPNGPELISLFLTFAGLGCCAPLDPSLTQDEYRFYLGRLCACALVLLDGQPAAAAEAARSLGMRIIRIQARLDQPAGIFEIVEVEAPTAIELTRHSDAALLLFTSATTDSPKLVPLTCGNLEAITHFDSSALGLDAADRLLSLMPLFHLHGLAAALTQLSVGGSVIGVAGFDPARFPAWIADLRPTWLSSNPPLNRAILALARQQAFREHSLRFIRSGTAAFEPELLSSVEKELGVPVVNGYGLTETGGVTREIARRRKSGSVGQSTGLEIAIVDPAGNNLPSGNEGSIVLRGPSVTSGYLDNPDANLETFRDGWFHTGDIGHLDHEGFLFITGRQKELINRGGKKVYPHEVEAALMAHAAVAQAAVCAVPHPTLGEDVAAAVVLHAGAAVSQSELRAFAATKLARYKIPRRIAFLDSIPTTATGKPRRGLLAEELLREAPLHRGSAGHVLDPIESVLLEIWRRVLAVEHVDVTDDFFALGGDSLAAAIMLTEVQSHLQNAAGLTDRVEFFDDPTIENLARIAAECGASPVPEAAAGSSRILPLREAGDRVPLFCFAASAQDPYYFRHLARHLPAGQPFFVVCHADPVHDGRLRDIAELARSSVESIRGARPQGPYFLAGHCYGGVVAFEAARQLISQGQQVLGLVLFDAATPGYPKVHKQFKRYAAKATQAVAALKRGKTVITATELRQHLHALGRIFARRRKGRASRVLTAIGSDALLAGRKEKELNGMAMWEYNPRLFSAPIVHFIAADQPVSAEILTDPRLGWSDFAAGGIEIRYVKGDHNSILGAENAAVLAAELSQIIPQPSLSRAALV